MLTRCPHCAVSFQITVMQLRARDGDVRCGACRKIFNAEKCLVSNAPPPTQRHTRNTDANRLNAQDMQLAPAYQALFLPDAQADEENERKNESLWWMWALATTVVLGLLITQGVIYFRSEIAAINVADKPYLAALCKPLGCQVGLPTKPQFLFIESSDMQPDVSGKLALFATLKNRDDIVLEYPHLEITLTDINNQPLLRRVLTPNEYLPMRVVASAGFPPKSEVNLSLSLAAPGINSVGYRLYIFYP